MRNEISLQERLAISTGRGSSMYLRCTQLRPQDFDGKKVLNVGAGKSDLQKELAEKYGVHCTVTNVDLGYNPRHKSILWNLIYKMRRAQFPANAVLANATQLPFKDGAFDIGVSSCAIIWLPEGRKRFLVQEMKRVTQGKVYIFPFDDKEHKTFVQPYFQEPYYSYTCARSGFSGGGTLVVGQRSPNSRWYRP